MSVLVRVDWGLGVGCHDTTFVDTDFTSTYIKSFLYIDGHVMRFAEGNVCVWVVSCIDRDILRGSWLCFVTPCPVQSKSGVSPYGGRR